MKFVPLSIVILLKVKRTGYNISTSKNTVDDENPTWYALTVADVNDYLLNLNCKGSIVRMEKSALLVINDALDNIDEEQLQGEVFIEIDHLQELEAISTTGFFSDFQFYYRLPNGELKTLANYDIREGPPA
ncbi:hypothetical protein ABE426_01420 [Sphingobacterium faecium]|uniref:hypothetical protein n=1 Tax=Sphingobacterium faecium TaxID=34087 RepID=UPI0032079FA5